MNHQIKLLVNIIVLCYFLSGCAAIDAVQFVYGNKLASHSWQSEERETTVPFELLNQHIIVKATVNGIPDLRVVLDTGAVASVFFETEKTRPLFNSLNSKISVSGIGKGDKTAAFFKHDTTLSVGSLVLSDLTTILIRASDNPLFPSPESTYIDGIIGYDLFSRLVTEIDFSQKRVQLSDGTFPGAGEFPSIPLKVENNLAYVEVTLSGPDGAVDLPMIFDTGAVGDLFLDSGQSLPQSTELYQATTSGLGGKALASVRQFESLSIGQFTLPNIVASVSQEPPSKNKTNFLGTRVINRFNMVVDYPSEQLFLIPNETFERASPVNVFGLTLMPHQQGAWVLNVRVGTPSETLGLMPQDLITSLNGEQIHHQNFDRLDEALSAFRDVDEICFVRNERKHCKQLTN